MSSLDYFYISAWLSLALILLCFIVRRPRVSEDMAVGRNELEYAADRNAHLRSTKKSVPEHERSTTALYSALSTYVPTRPVLPPSY